MPVQETCSLLLLMPVWLRLSLPVFFSGFAGGLITVTLLLHACKRFQLTDQPNGRKEHQTPVPTMGGLAFIAGTITGLCFFSPYYPSYPVLFCLVAIALTGAIDDYRDLNPVYKLLLQLVIAAVLASSGMRLENLQGLFGIYALPVFTQYLLTILAITAVTNAFNLIDGIDGLAGGIGLISLAILGLMLQANGDTAYSLFAFALAGGMLGFLFFNVQPARIFMGDTGSLFLGFSIALLCLRLLQITPGKEPVSQPLLAAFALVALPIMDAARLFFDRLIKGRSPFSPDRNHLHHQLTRKGYSHRTTSIILMVLHYLLIAMGFLLQNIPVPTALLQIMVVPMLASAALQRLPQASIRRPRTNEHLA